MRFAHPQALWLLGLVPVLIGLTLWDLWRRRRTLARLGHLPTLRRMVASTSPLRRALKGVAVALAFAGAAVALARPQHGGKSQLLRRRGIDIVVALDFSKSMLARDVRPSRLERAKLELGHLIDGLGGDRVGMVAFAGEVLRYPLTTDYAAAKLFWRDLQPSDMPVGGTAIGRALQAGLELLEGASGKKRKAGEDGEQEGDAGEGEATEEKASEEKKQPATRKRARVILLVSDGEDTESDPIAAAEAAKKAGVRVYTLGLGSISGDLVPEVSADGRGVDYLRKPGGGYVTAKLDETTLRKIADITGGRYVRSTPQAFGVDALRAELRKLEATEEGGTLVRQYDEGYLWALVPALLLLGLEPLLGDRRRRRREEAEGGPSPAGPAREARS